VLDFIDLMMWVGGFDYYVVLLSVVELYGVVY